MALPAFPPPQDYSLTVPDITQQWPVRGADPGFVIGQRDQHGVLYWWEDLVGWFRSADMTVTVNPFGNSDRAVAPSRFPRKERYITIQGHCEVERPEDLWPARERLITAWDKPNEEDAFDLIVEEPVPKSIRVRSAGPVDAPWDRDHHLSFDFEIPLVALSPFKRGLDRLSGITGPSVPGELLRYYPRTYPLTYSAPGTGSAGSLVINNRGNADTFPTITITGPLESGWSVINERTGEAFSLDTSVTSGQQLTVDMDAHTALINNFPVQIRRDGDWLRLKPGLNPLKFLAPNPEPVLTVVAYALYK